MEQKTLYSTGSITLTDKELRIDGEYSSFINGYLTKTSGSRTIKISDLMSIRYYKVRSKRRLMTALYIGGGTLFLKTLLHNLTSSLHLRQYMLSLKDSTTTIYYVGLAISGILLLLYATSQKNLLDISYLGGRVCFNVKDFAKADLDKLIAKFYALRS